ncbi:MAG: cation transporter [Asgard group archaeon]|nr:cation transporter [Asgard group archaeon]
MSLDLSPQSTAVGKKEVNRMKIARNVTIIGLILNLVLATLKITISIYFNSTALLADGLDSALDIATVILGYVAIQIADRPADADHHFGHAKIESLFSVGIAVLLIISSGIISYQAITKLIDKTQIEFEIFNVIVAASSIVLKGVLVAINIIIGKRIKSSILVANGKNFRTDILTSAVVLISVSIGHLSVNGFSLYWVDPTIALIISVVIILTAVGITKDSSKILLDQSPNEETLNDIHRITMKQEGVIKIGQIRARNIGSDIILTDIDIYVNPSLTVEEGHHIATKIESSLKAELPIRYVHVHYEPYYKEKDHTSKEDTND